MGRVGFDFAGEGGRGGDLDGDFVAGLELEAWLGAGHALEEFRVAEQRGEVEELLALDNAAVGSGLRVPLRGRLREAR